MEDATPDTQTRPPRPTSKPHALRLCLKGLWKRLVVGVSVEGSTETRAHTHTRWSVFSRSSPWWSVEGSTDTHTHVGRVFNAVRVTDVSRSRGGQQRAAQTRTLRGPSVALPEAAVAAHN